MVHYFPVPMSKRATAVPTSPIAEPVRSCYRCGAEFRSLTRRIVCDQCRTVGFPPRQRQVCELIAEGKSNKDIAFQLHLSEGTVKEYLNRIYRKLNISNRTELAIRILTDPPY